MAVVVEVTAPDSTIAEYEAIMREAGLWGVGIDEVPGARAHYAWEDNGGVHVIDVWESEEAFNDFFPATIVPAAQRAGIELHPKVSIFSRCNSIP
jgi:heme-degrading monooxygenase HmoA